MLVGEYGTTLQRRNRIDVFSFLPSETAPVLVYMGTTSDGKRAVFLVAKDVIELRGPGFCFPSEDSCQLLALKPRGRRGPHLRRPTARSTGSRCCGWSW